jgi:signal transduction histidine kinase
LINGLVALLILQLVLFLGSGLAWQGILAGSQWMPILDRAVTLLSLVVIIWLWAFPEPAPYADAAALMLVLIVAIAAVFGGLWWINQPASTVFNGTLLDIAAQVGAIVLLLFGMLVLVIRRIEGWEYGLIMLGLILGGCVLHLVMLPYGQDYPGAVRLGQMAAYPFLLFLPQRALALASAKPAVEPARDQASSGEAASTAARLGADGLLWNSLLQLSAETRPEQVRRELVALLAKTLEADICLLLSPPGEKGTLTLQCGYDQRDKRYLESFSIESRSLPVLSSSLRMGRARRLSATSSSPDVGSLASALGLEEVGNVIFAPLLSSDGKPVTSVVLLSPYTGRDWTNDEQAYLNVLAKLLVHFLQHSQEMTTLRDEIEQVRQVSRFAQDQRAQALEESQRLRVQLSVLREKAGIDPALLGGAAVLAELDAQSSQAATIAQLQAENEKLREAARLAEVASVDQDESPAGELRLALEEISFLQIALDDADDKLSALKLAHSNLSPSGQQMAVIASIAQDLRQPLASISGYTDFLLGETIGVLGAMQRKYLERIKVSTERMGRLMDDLLQTLSMEGDPDRLEWKEADFCELVEGAVSEAGGKMPNRVSWRVDLPGEPLPVTTDQAALQRVLVGLLENAGLASPEGGDVAVSARLETNERDEDYVLLRVADSGQGIAAQDLPYVFSLRPAEAPIMGLAGNGTELASVKRLVELLGGRTWVDSEPGQGATFCVLLPVAPAVSGEVDQAESL